VRVLSIVLEVRTLHDRLGKLLFDVLYLVDHYLYFSFDDCDVSKVYMFMR
jgi:hypothetical protein